MTSRTAERKAAGLVADIGGTHARFALAAPDGRLSATLTLSTAAHASLVEALHAYLSRIGAVAPARAVLAVATPVTGDAIAFTNCPWHFSIAATRRALGFEHLEVINDFAALAHALPYLRGRETSALGHGRAARGAPMAVLGPGTGLGVAALVPAGAQWIALPGEGGHASFSPADEREAALLRIVWRTHAHVSAERLISGPGLSVLADALCEQRARAPLGLDAAAIATRAAAGDELCTEAIAVFCAMLGGFAGNVALTLGARGGVFIGGGIAPRLADVLARSAFRARFEAKGRFAPYLARIPTRLILAPTAALRGAAAVLHGRA